MTREEFTLLPEIRCNVRHKVVHITPKLAKLWLGVNDKNRRLCKDTEAKYASQMTAGEWKLTGEAIIFSEAGRLLNGQHRLEACIKADTAFDSSVIFGIEDDAFAYMDKGKVRSDADVFSICGIKDSVAAAAVVLRVMKYDNGVCWYSPRSTRMKESVMQKLMAYEREREDYAYCIRFCGNLRGGSYKLPIHKSIITALMFILHNRKGYTYDKIETFLSSLTSYSSCQNQMIDQLRIRLLKNENETKKYDHETILMMIIKVWNAYVLGRQIKCIRWDRESEGEIEIW